MVLLKFDHLVGAYFSQEQWFSFFSTLNSKKRTCSQTDLLLFFSFFFFLFFFFSSASLSSSDEEEDDEEEVDALRALHEEKKNVNMGSLNIPRPYRECRKTNLLLVTFFI